jgi:phosphatidylglycerophosphatase A
MNTPDNKPTEDVPEVHPEEKPVAGSDGASGFQSRLGLPGKVATAIATLGPLGMRMPAPGTWGSGAGCLLYFLFFARYNNLDGWATYLGLAVAFVVVAIVVCHFAEKHLGVKDPGQIIFDEFAAMPLVFIGAESFVGGAGNYAWVWFFGGFVLFRLFDIIKPFGIKKLQRLPGGIGIVVDDLAAAAASCVALHLIHFLAKFFCA